ncbi:hypothetical protein C0993_011818, partial [Termitomyces sp. T159_Od127]
MTLEDSLAVFYKASQRDEEEAAKELVQGLGFLALAIVQAGSYLLHNQHIGVKQYLESYKKDMPRYLANTIKQKMDKYQFSVFATWNLSYQKLDEKSKAILMLCSVFHNSKIPMSILEKAWNNLSNVCGINTQELQDFLRRFLKSDKGWSDELLDDALNMLRSYSLVELRGIGVRLLEIHSLVHEWAFESISKEKQKKAKQCAQQLFYCLGSEELEYNDAAQLVLHVQALINRLNHKCDNEKVAERLSRIFSVAYFWNDAEKLQQQVLKGCQKVLSSNHPDTICAMSSLAVTLREGGKLEEAEKLDQEVLRLRTEAFGISHPDTTKAMSNLAATLRRSGKLENAQRLCQQVLDVSLEVFGKSHPDTIRAMFHLAVTLRMSGKVEEAEKLLQEVLKIRTEAFGTNHPDTIETMFQLAATFWRSGKLEEAEKLQQEVLRVRKEAFRTSHPDTIQAMSYLAATLSRGGKFEEAEKLEQEVLK